MSGFGGGFLLNQGGGGGNNHYGDNNNYQNSASKNNVSPNKGADNRKKGSIIPLTIKKLLEASARLDDIVEVDGVPVDQAVLIGRVYKLEEQSTRIILHMDDSTGRIQIAYYKKTDAQANSGLDKFYYEENMYVKAVVSVRPFKTQKMYVSNMLQTVTDYNQVSYHFLSTFLASAYRIKGPMQKPDPNVSTQNANAQGNNNNNNNNQGGYQPMGLRDQSNHANKDPLSIVKDVIGQIQHNTANGICKQSQLVGALKGKMDSYVINECVMRLENNAEICRDESGNQSDPGFVLLGEH